MGKLNKLTLPNGCQHPHWNIDNHNVGVCILCGEKRRFPWEGNGKPETLEPGISLAREPKNLPREVKSRIANFAKQNGIGATMKASGLEMHIIRAWVGAYCRTKGRDKAVDTAKSPTIILQRFTQADCFICDGPLFGDNKWTPHFLETPTGKVWLCGVCADGVKRLLDLVGISCQITEGTPNE